MLQTGVGWQDLSDQSPSPDTCNRRFQEWCKGEVLEKLLQALAKDLNERGDLDLSEYFIDGFFVLAKIGAAVRKTKWSKGTKVKAMADRHGFPIAMHSAPSAPHEVTLLEATLATRFVLEASQWLKGDRVYDCDPLDERLRAEGIGVIALYLTNQVKPVTQDRCHLRWYRRRWKIERLIAGLQNYCRVLVHYGRTAENYLGRVHLACIILLLNEFLR